VVDEADGTDGVVTAGWVVVVGGTVVVVDGAVVALGADALDAPGEDADVLGTLDDEVDVAASIATVPAIEVTAKATRVRGRRTLSACGGRRAGRRRA
jgi:hypothetical protein